MPTKPKHTHKWRRKEKGTWRKARFQCADPHCYALKSPHYLMGKLSRCCKCDAEFTLDRDQLENAFPKCMMCRDTQEAREYRAIKEVAEEVMKGSEVVIDPIEVVEIMKEEDGEI